MRRDIFKFAVVVVLLLSFVLLPGYSDTAEAIKHMAERKKVVIDPGHGGIDGGAESRDGICEKDINLYIAKKLKKQLEKENIRIVMTRKGGEGLYDDSCEGAIRSLKTEDMRRRKEIIDEACADIVVSIHLNSFTQDTSVKGAQVFYPASGDEAVLEASKRAAELVQEGMNDEINLEKKRTALAKGDVFLLRDVMTPIIIVECGFLSNSDEAENLKKDNYQDKIVKVLQKSICLYLDVEKP